MNKPLKTLLLNPPSFENFDGGASSRWPAVREIESYWYPVWLAYPAGLLEGSRLLDAPPHHVSADETIEIAKGYEFLVLFTSTVGWAGDHALAQAIKKPPTRPSRSPLSAPRSPQTPTAPSTSAPPSTSSAAASSTSPSLSSPTASR